MKGLVFMPHDYTFTCGRKMGTCTGRCKCKKNVWNIANANQSVLKSILVIIFML